jgi:anti-anti-sigma factor
MKLSTDHREDVAIVRISESRMMYPLLSEFSTAVTSLISSGSRKLLIDMSAVGYIDSATIGCLMDLYRQMTAAGGAFKLSGVQRRVETMLTMTGAHNFIDIHQDEARAIESFGGSHAHN